ncbi:hypothetical protein OH799_07155 [Nocardia sp. NBC_00881]|uniref:hypothetical protein n=1 Tax=Nocardia sp. NBC_00881 TaxID=2975995 RepID=UPI0038640DD6|nr:hypothetical protein OH799_07155 [Nocardia sp. NBC_00881]
MTDGAVLATAKRPLRGPISRLHKVHANVEFGFAEEMHIPSQQMGFTLLDTLEIATLVDDWMD